MEEIWRTIRWSSCRSGVGKRKRYVETIEIQGRQERRKLQDGRYFDHQEYTTRSRSGDCAFPFSFPSDVLAWRISKLILFYLRQLIEHATNIKASWRAREAAERARQESGRNGGGNGSSSGQPRPQVANSGFKRWNSLSDLLWTVDGLAGIWSSAFLCLYFVLGLFEGFVIFDYGEIYWVYSRFCGLISPELWSPSSNLENLWPKLDRGSLLQCLLNVKLV